MEYTKQVTVSEMMLMGGTRVMTGAGLALLLGERATPEQRRAVGWTLLVAGSVISIPVVFGIISARREKERLEGPRIAA